MDNTHVSLCGRTSPELSAQTKAKTSVSSAKSSSRSSSRQPLCLVFRRTAGLMPTITTETDGALLTEFLTLNTGESPQRRRRIHLVADFRGECAKEVLFERQGVRGYFKTSGTQGQATPSNAQGSLGANDPERKSNGGNGRQLDVVALAPVASTLRAGAGAPKHESDFVGRLVIDRCILDDQGGSSINVRQDGQAPTLRAEAHGNLPCVMEPKSAAFCPEQSAKTRGIGYEVGKSPTLRAGVTPACVYSVENHPADSRVNIDKSGKVQTLTSRMGTGGGNVPMIMEPEPVIRMATLQAQGVPHVVCYMSSNQFLFENHSQDTRYKGPLNVAPIVSATFGMGGNNQPFIVESVICMATQQGGSEIRTDDKAPTLTAAAGMSGNNQPVICLQGNGIDRSDTAGCNGKGWKEDTCYTLNTIDRPAVAYGFDPGASRDVGSLFLEGISKTLANGTCPGHHAGVVEAHVQAESVCDYKDPPCVPYPQQAYDKFIEDDVGTTLKACGGSYGGGSETLVLNTQPPYIVRRLTPTECARLQGFAGTWGQVAKKDTFTDEEYSFWLEVRNTHAGINGKTVKDYTQKQMLTWYNKLWTDSAEYKMWGNGIALPPALYCMQGIVDALNAEEVDEWMT